MRMGRAAEEPDPARPTSFQNPFNRTYWPSGCARCSIAARRRDASVDSPPRRAKAGGPEGGLVDGEDVVDASVLRLVDFVRGLDEERGFAEALERDGDLEPATPKPKGDGLGAGARELEVVGGGGDGIGVAGDEERDFAELLVGRYRLVHLDEARLELRLLGVVDLGRVATEVDFFVGNRNRPGDNRDALVRAVLIVGEHFDAPDVRVGGRGPGDDERAARGAARKLLFLVGEHDARLVVDLDR